MLKNVNVYELFYFVRVVTFSIYYSNWFSKQLFRRCVSDEPFFNYYHHWLLSFIFPVQGTSAAFPEKLCLLVRSMCFTSNLRRVLNTGVSQRSHGLGISSGMSEPLLSFHPLTLSLALDWLVVSCAIVHTGACVFHIERILCDT